MNPEVTEYVQQRAAWQSEICERLRYLVQEVIPQAEERLWHGKPYYIKNGWEAADIEALADAVRFTLYNAQDVEVIEGVTQPLGSGERKAAEIHQGDDVDYTLLGELLARTSSGL
ncbi:DUF1801 domain-containing protein [Rhodococcus sp. X156]|uniref:DUF1801 domain-containing protein n=1 Tax=Rhodococcus sp. X156 TaxID=2499145 RepID=UPI000FD742D2|nr:DUF1801 domain-containing protein [Rhodococcus sp. X156]